VKLKDFNKLTKQFTDMRQNMRIMKTKIGELESGGPLAA
jgi:hypothetical protein